MSTMVNTEFTANRRTLLLGFSAFVVTGASTPPAPRVLFICQFGTAKSAIARELFRRRARERGISVSAFSRGVTLENHVSSSLLAALRDEGIDPARDRRRTLSKRDLQAADLVVVFNPLPNTLKPVVVHDWTTVPSVNESWPQARADLLQRIDSLLDEITRARR